jgi:hypothetical protein
MMSWRLAAVLGAALSLLGCDSKTRQCNRLIGVINKEQEPLKKEPPKLDDPGSLRTFGDTLDGVAKQVSTVELKDEELGGFRDNYAKMAKDLAKVARDMANAVEAKDVAKQSESGKTMSTFEGRENELVGGLNGYCQSR